MVVNNGRQYDYTDYDLAGFNSAKNMAQCFVDDYEEMIISIGKYDGFYAGRYEMSGTITTPLEQANKTPMTGTWYNLYKACKAFSNNAVESRMIWGCQWDIICNYIATDINYSITDSSSWGNYLYTEVLSSDRTTILKASGTETKLNTGITTFTMTKNLYDMAGNYFELTQEAYHKEYRCARGGYFRTSDSTPSVVNRTSTLFIPSESPNRYNPTSRPTLYIK